VILMFHHVRPRVARTFAPNRRLEITPAFLDLILSELHHEGFDIVPLAAVHDRLRSDGHAPPFAALTFDDGYRDNVEHAWPILRRHGAPWTLFVTTEFTDGRGRLWWVELEEAIIRLDRVVLRLDGELLDLPTRTVNEKQGAFDSIYRRLRTMPEERLRAATADLAGQAGVDARHLTNQLCLSWDELQSLAREPDVTIGAHTLSHPMLASCDATTAAPKGGPRAPPRTTGPASCLPIRRCCPRPARMNSTLPARCRLCHRAQGTSFPITALTCTHYRGDGLFKSRSAVRALFSGVPFLPWNLSPFAKA
jgi:peptidoglycan/xylan/chitin deacetylase (PgdA/CDA1 family)